MDTNQLLTLCEAWEKLARCKFISADAEKNPMGKQFIEHGAMCYFNCAQELRKVLEVPLQPKSEPALGDQT